MRGHFPSYGKFGHLFSGPTEGNIEEELDIERSISSVHEKGDWTWCFTCVIAAVSVTCLEIHNFSTQSIQNEMMRLDQLDSFFEFALLMNAYDIYIHL